MDEQNHPTHQDPFLNLLFNDGLQNALPRIAEILINAAMLLERETHIGAAPYQRGVERSDREKVSVPCGLKTNAKTQEGSQLLKGELVTVEKVGAGGRITRGTGGFWTAITANSCVDTP